MQQGRPYGSGVGTVRITAFSDGVFAIAITLLVLDLGVPEVASHGPAAKAAALLALQPRIMSFVLSFLIIALDWMLHHRTFSYIERYNPALLWLNMLYLLGITFLPFPIRQFPAESRGFVIRVLLPASE